MLEFNPMYSDIFMPQYMPGFLYTYDNSYSYFDSCALNQPLFNFFNSNKFVYNPNSGSTYNLMGLYLSDVVEPQSFNPFADDNMRSNATASVNRTNISNRTHRSRRHNSGNVVYLNTLNLNGKISGGNSKPCIAKENVQNLIELDRLLSSWGYEVTYTSCMGGKHCNNSGHYKGNKVDLQLRKNSRNARLTPEQSEKLRTLGYWGSGTGAVGWESVAQQVGGGHYDLCIA